MPVLSRFPRVLKVLEIRSADATIRVSSAQHYPLSLPIHRPQILVQPGKHLLDELCSRRDVIRLVELELFVRRRSPQEFQHRRCEDVSGGKYTSYFPFKMRVGGVLHSGYEVEVQHLGPPYPRRRPPATRTLAFKRDPPPQE